MFSLNKIQNRLHRRYYLIGFFGFAALSFGYILRGTIGRANPLVSVLMDTFPNLFGSFATPFILSFLLARTYPASKALDRPWVFVLANAFTFAVCLLIEQLHVVFQLGLWDWKDVTASVIGGLSSLLVYFIARLNKPSA